MFKKGMIHGRFQPFHIGHFDYLKMALNLVEECLVVGITNPSPELIKNEMTDNHRHLPEANRFTFFERLEMIHKSIFSSKEISFEQAKKVIITPFPIHDESLWRLYIPKDVTQIMSAFEEWDFEKEKRFKFYGFETFSLNCKRITSGTTVREAIDNQKNWKSLVPDGTRQVLQSKLNL